MDHTVQVVLAAKRGRTMPAYTKNALGIIAYPRTGKRGVPQQFPRRLYEMLHNESKLLEGSSDHKDIIAWSDSGKAFCILDVPFFSSDVLPRYFRTSKFSSFQRNLNLYGFTKVRRGPDVDMYVHPSFRRDQPETLSLLRKCTSASGRKRSPSSSISEFSSTNSVVPHSRAVSPSPPGSPKRPENISIVHGTIGKSVLFDRPKVELPISCLPLESCEGAGRLDILTMALASLAERDYESNRQLQQV